MFVLTIDRTLTSNITPLYGVHEKGGIKKYSTLHRALYLRTHKGMNSNVISWTLE